MIPANFLTGRRGHTPNPKPFRCLSNPGARKSPPSGGPSRRNQTAKHVKPTGGANRAPCKARSAYTCSALKLKAAFYHANTPFAPCDLHSPVILRLKSGHRKRPNTPQNVGGNALIWGKAAGRGGKRARHSGKHASGCIQLGTGSALSQ